MTIDGNDYVLYEESDVLDKGKYSYVSHNSFQFEGEKFDFQMNYMSGAYICSFDNKNNYPHFVLNYQSSAVVIYKNEKNK